MPSLSVNKAAIFQAILTVLSGQVEAHARAAKDAFAAATDPGSKAENKYDTRSLEASYLARGQALRVAEAGQALAEFKGLRLRALAPDEPVALGALVVMQGAEGRSAYFLGPSAGGTEVTHEGLEVLVITPGSPLGGLLLGKRAGMEVILPGARRGSRIESVS